MSDTPLAEMIGATRRQGNVLALSGVDLVVHGGDTVLLLGANGAGKSTLLRLLAGLLRPRRGVVRIAGRDATRDSGARRMVGYLAHQSMSYDDLTARENLAFVAALAVVAEPSQRVSEVLEQVGLTARADHPLRTFSRGMQQRLALARAIVATPRLLLLDEPFTGLDSEGAATLRDVVTGQSANGGATICVTHDPAELWEQASRVVILDGGRVIADAVRPVLPSDLGAATAA